MSYGYPTCWHLSDLAPSLSVIKHLTCTGHLQIRRCESLDLRSVHISYGILLTDLPGTILRTLQVISRANPQKDSGRVAKLIMDRTMSNRVLFHRERILFSPRYVKNSLERYSPPRSHRRILILFPVCFFISLRYRLNISIDSDLCLKRHNHTSKGRL